MQRSWSLPLVFLICLVPQGYAQTPHRWEFGGSVGYARSLTLRRLDGGLEFGFSASKQLGQRKRLELAFGAFRLGEDSTTILIPGSGAPFDPDLFITTEEEQNGWHLTGSLLVPLDAAYRFSLIVGGGFYNVKLKRITEGRDSTGAIVRPATGGTSTSRGPGGVAGIRFQPLRFGQNVALSFDLQSHVLGLFGSGNTGDSFTFVQFFSGRMGITVGF